MVPTPQPALGPDVLPGHAPGETPGPLCQLGLVAVGIFVGQTEGGRKEFKFPPWKDVEEQTEDEWDEFGRDRGITKPSSCCRVGS